MVLSIKNGGYAFLIRLDLMFSVIVLCLLMNVKRVPVVTNFKRPIYHIIYLN